MIRLISTMLLILGTLASTQIKNNLFEETLEVFEWGKYTTYMVNKSTLNYFNAPKSLVIITPKEEGIYPILYFVHGFEIPNNEYSQLFNFIASHGFIVVAPMLYNILLPPSQQAEIDNAANVANWLSSNLNKANPTEPSMHLLPDHVTANFSNFIASGHSRGGKTAFALALGLTKTITLEPKVSALIAVDPVAGLSILNVKFPTKPCILTNVNNSINLTIPTMIIGTGLGGSCTPSGLNHNEFYKESKKASQFVAADYGHCDMLNDDVFASLGRALCGTVKLGGSYDSMRRTVGGLVVAFINAYFDSRPEDYNDIFSHSSVAPVKLYPVENKGQPLPY